MKNPDAIYVTIDVRLEWIEPPKDTEERAKRVFAQTFITSEAAKTSARINRIIAELLERKW